MISFSEHLKKTAEPIWDAQFTHPFVQGLGDGTLPGDKFKFYILQDSLFLFELAKIFAAAAMRATDPSTMAMMTKLQHDTIEVERALHAEYGRLWNMTPEEMAAVPMTPTNYAYTRHMRDVARTGSLCEITVVMLPCAWIYCEVGVHFLRGGPPSERHPYKNWLNLYASPEFAEVARWMREKVDLWVLDTGDEEKRRMEEMFVISSRYEWMFWEMAWRTERWPV